MSVGFHTVLLIALALVTSPVVSKAPRGDADREAGIAIVRRSQAEASYFTETDAESLSAVAAIAPENSPSEPSPLAEMPVEFAVQLPSSSDAATSTGVGNILPDAIGFTAGTGQAKAIPGGQARTQVFGAEGTGTKFVYVFDRSASMQGFQGRPMVAATSQLSSSLKDLDSVHQFQIVFYNDAPAVFNPDRPQPPSMLFASDENKRLAREFIERVSPVGGTRHLEAINLALGMRPDVVFFLTDAAEPQLTPRELAGIKRRNRSEATIHSIEFGSGPFRGGDNFLVRLARQNGGKHVYVDVTKLK
ncbi:MAG: hypothetical protein CMJ64_11020 [Planctomycetaceae bacterium]|nr:hypothetical protein [Planctomycetaceae bacterium]